MLLAPEQTSPAGPHSISGGGASRPQHSCLADNLIAERLHPLRSHNIWHSHGLSQCLA